MKTLGVKYQVFCIPVTVGLVLIILLSTDLRLIPDAFGLSKAQDPGKVLEIIMSIIGSILGVSLALILIGFEMYKTRFGKIGISRFLRNPNAVFIITFQVTVLLSSFILFLKLGKKADYSEITAIYFLSVLFVIGLILIWPIGKRMLSESESYESIVIETQNITIKNVAKIIGYNHGIADYKKELEEMDSSPFLILRGLGIKYIKEDNQHAAAHIIQESTKNFLHIIKDDIDRRVLTEAYNALFIIWNGIITESVKAESYLPLKQIWNSIEELYTYYADNSIGLIRTETLEDFCRDYIDILFKYNQDDILTNCVFHIENIFQRCLNKGLPDENLIKDLDYMFNLDRKVEHNIEIEIQWHYIAQNIPGLLEKIIDKSIQTKKERIFDFATSSLSNFIRVVRIEKIGKYQESYIVGNIVSTIFYDFGRAAESNMINSFRASGEIGSFTMTDIIRANPPYLKRTISSVVEYVKDLQLKGKLNVRFADTLGGKMRLLSQLYNENPVYSEVTDYLLNLIGWLKLQFEAKLESNTENYLALHELVISLEKWHKLEDKFSSKDGFKPKPKEKWSIPFLEQIKALSTSFLKIEEAKRALEKNDIVWKK